MIKITFMGAGSTVFARNVLGDCMCTPALRESEIALYDIDEKRLEDSRIILSAINHNVNEDRAVIKTYLGAENRKDALRDADFVVNAIQVGGYEPCTVTDFEIPKKYGIKQTIADTLGIGGIMRALRTIPVLEEFARSFERQGFSMELEEEEITEAKLLDTIRQLYTDRQKYTDAMAGNGRVDSISKITDLIEECARS